MKWQVVALAILLQMLGGLAMVGSAANGNHLVVALSLAAFGLGTYLRQNSAASRIKDLEVELKELREKPQVLGKTD